MSFLERLYVWAKIPKPNPSLQTREVVGEAAYAAQQQQAGEGGAAAEAPAQVDHSLWDEILHACVAQHDWGEVKGSGFDYAQLMTGQLADKFDQYLDVLAGADMAAIEQDDNALAALFINSYNALCVKKIVTFMRQNGGPGCLGPPPPGPAPDGPRLTSINNLTTRADGPVWKQEAGLVGGKMFSLDDIENAVLRAWWREPGFHACIVCASRSCPDLRAEAYIPTRLRDQIDGQLREWMSNQTKGLLVEESTKGSKTVIGVTVSRILLWFANDFKLNRRPVLDWVVAHAPELESAVIRSGNDKRAKVNLGYMEYSWLLNLPPRADPAAAAEPER